MLGADIRSALRALRRSPGFSVLAIVTLALGIGVTTIVFGALNAVVLRPLPIADPAEVVLLESNRLPSMSFPDYLDVQRDNRSFSGLAAYRITSMALDSGAGADNVWGYLATGNYFQVLGITPAAGRLFTPDDDRVRNGSPYAVLSYATWRGRFNGDPGIAGRTVRINGLPYTILGVAPASFDGTEVFYRPALWVPMSMQPQIEGRSWLDDRVSDNSLVIGRLRPGTTQAQALADLDPIARSIAAAHPRTHEGFGFRLTTPGLFGSGGRGPVTAFMSGVLLLAILVVIASSTNLASLLAARVIDRAREIAIRLSLGASRLRIARQLLVETAALAVLGGAGGLALAVVVLRLLTSWRLPLPIPVRFLVTPDAWVFVFAFGVTVAAGLLAALAPLRRAWRTEPSRLTGPTGELYVRRGWSARDLLLGLQVAVCCLLVMCAIVSLRGLARAVSAPIGFEPAGVSAVGVDLSVAGYDAASGTAFKRRLLDEVAQIPGVSRVALVNALALTPDQNNSDVFPDDGREPRPANALTAAVYYTSPGYFEVMRTRLLSGRDFGQDDRIDTPAVAIVNQVFAARVMRTTDPVGRRFRYGPSGRPMTVVGMVETGKYYALNEAPRPTVFFPVFQRYNSSTMIVARTSLGETQGAAAIGAVVRRADARLPLQVQQGVPDALALAFLPSQVALASLGTFGALALVLAIAGVYGGAAYAVSSRTRELGIRQAVGGTQAQVLSSVLARTGTLLATGSILGIALGTAFQGALDAVVYEASARDPLLVGAVVLMMCGVGLVATWIPARQALRLDPAQILRS